MSSSTGRTQKKTMNERVTSGLQKPPPRPGAKDAVDPRDEPLSSAVSRMGAKMSEHGIRMLIGVLRALGLVVVFVLDYSLAFAVGTRIIPDLVSGVAAGTGVQLTGSIEAVIVGWLAPSLFLLLIAVAFTLWLMRAFWRGVDRGINALKRALLLGNQHNGPKSAAR